MENNELKVLLLEDNPGDAFLLKFYLGESTNPVFTVTHAETLKAALDYLADGKFDIIVSDMNLPDSFGVDTIKNILFKYPGNMLIVLTGLTDEEVGLETVRYGAQDFLVKGKFDGKVLISSLMFAFERFKLNSRIAQENNRIDSIQRLLNVGYFEVDADGSNLFCTDFALKLLGCDAGIDSTHEVKQAFIALAAKQESGETRFKKSSDGCEFIILYQFENGKLSGVVKPA